MQMQLVSAMGTAINTTLAALTAVTGDSLTVPTFPDTKKAWILQVWADVQVAGTARLRWPQGHDNVNGIRVDTIIGDTTPMLPWGFPVRIYPNTPISVELAGSAVAGDVEHVCMLQLYEELPGQLGQYISPADLKGKMEALVTVENTITTGTAGIWSGAEAISAEINQFRSDLNYAILGFKTDTECAGVGYRANAWANTRIGGPGIETEPWLVSDWFAYLSTTYGYACIPFFAGGDHATVQIEALIDENGADPTITTFLAAFKR